MNVLLQVTRTIDLRLLCLVALCCLVTASKAADVQLNVPNSTETYVGLPFIANLQISNSEDHEPPTIDPIDGLDIQRSGPSTSSRVSITTDSNGTRRLESSSHVYTFSITPQRVGKFTIPPIKVIADGIATVTKAIKIEAKESVTGDLLRVEVDAKQKSVYVGEPLEVTLRILVKCFTDEKLGLRLSEESMWSLVRSESEWGFFSDRMKEMQKEHLRPGGKILERKDDAGELAEYYAYEIDATVYPKRAGSIDGGDVNIVVHYPQAIKETESPFEDRNDFFRRAFGGGLFQPRMAISDVRPITAGASVNSVQVKPIPEQGRPDDYRGAVGKYKIITEAGPRSCTAGDPIQLRIAIDGTGPMELVRAPDLADLEILTNDFKVADEPLAGFVNGNRKTFATTIRPKNENVKSIPAIPYSYFDPELEEFVTVHSEPIWIYVEKADTLSLDHLAASKTTMNKPDDMQAGINATSDTTNALDKALSIDSMMRPQQRAKALNGWMWCLLLVPPGVALLSQLILRRKRIASTFGRLVPADRQFARKIAKAISPEQIADATQAYLARITGKEERLPAIGILRAMNRSNTAVQAERLYAACESPHFAHDKSEEFVRGLKAEAMRLIEAIQSDSAIRRSSVALSNARTTNRLAKIVGWTILSTCCSQPAVAEQAMPLSESQIKVLLIEATEALKNTDAETSERAAEQFAIASERLQMVIDSGLSNGPLHYTAGKAYEGAGKRGLATAAFLRALRYDPTNLQYRTALTNTQASNASVTTSESRIEECYQAARRFKEQLIAVVPMQLILAIFAACWCIFWGLVILRTADRIRSVWLYATATALIALVSGWIYFDTVNESTRTDLAVLLSDNVELRDGDATFHPVVSTLSDSEGMIVEEMSRRGDWIRIRAGDRVGWILRSNIDAV